MLQKDGFFRKRDDGNFASKTTPPAPAPAANTVPAPSTPSEPPYRADERKEAKLVVGPEIKIKGVEISDCDTLVVEGRIEATLDSRVLEITQNGVFQGTIAVDNAEIRGRNDAIATTLLTTERQNIPVMGGIACLRQIRADRNLQSLPVIMVTMSSFDQDEKKAYEAGANLFLYKDIDLDRFSENLDAALKRLLA